MSARAVLQRRHQTMLEYVLAGMFAMSALIMNSLFGEVHTPGMYFPGNVRDQQAQRRLENDLIDIHVHLIYNVLTQLQHRLRDCCPRGNIDRGSRYIYEHRGMPKEKETRFHPEKMTRPNNTRLWCMPAERGREKKRTRKGEKGEVEGIIMHLAASQIPRKSGRTHTLTEGRRHL